MRGVVITSYTDQDYGISKAYPNTGAALGVDVAVILAPNTPRNKAELLLRSRPFNVLCFNLGYEREIHGGIYRWTTTHINKD